MLVTLPGFAWQCWSTIKISIQFIVGTGWDCCGKQAGWVSYDWSHGMWGWIQYSGVIKTVILFSQTTGNRHLLASLWGQDMTCLLWVKSLTYFLPLLLSHHAQCHVIYCQRLFLNSAWKFAPNLKVVQISSLNTLKFHNKQSFGNLQSDFNLDHSDY